jgi:hypothetical protein
LVSCIGDACAITQEGLTLTPGVGRTVNFGGD